MDVTGACVPLKLDLEERIDQANTNQMRFFIRSPLNADYADQIPMYFPDGCVPMPIPEASQLSPWPWDGFSDPFMDISAHVAALRVSYLAPCIHLNQYLDWVTFDLECEQGLHNPDIELERPSNIARRTYIEVFAHSVLVSLKSALDRLVPVASFYFPGLSSHMTWGRIENGKTRNFMSIVERGRRDDELLEYLSRQYEEWIRVVVAPRDEIIHYADLLVTWKFQSGAEGVAITPVHSSSRQVEAPVLNASALSSFVNAYYALADRALLTLAARVPRSVLARARVAEPSLGSAIMHAFDIPPSPRVAELKREVKDAITNGEVAANQAPEVYIAFLRSHADRFRLGPES
jgi:hypothetical protein